MSPLRRLFIAALALAGALSWGPPAVLALCLGGGTCRMAIASSREEAPSCCRKAPTEGPAVAQEDPAGACCGCCKSVRVGLGIDGPEVRVETPVPPPAPSPALLVPAYATPGDFAFPAAPAGPRPPPEKVLPLRI